MPLPGSIWVDPAANKPPKPLDDIWVGGDRAYQQRNFQTHLDWINDASNRAAVSCDVIYAASDASSSSSLVPV